MSLSTLHYGTESLWNKHKHSSKITWLANGKFCLQVALCMVLVSIVIVHCLPSIFHIFYSNWTTVTTIGDNLRLPRLLNTELQSRGSVISQRTYLMISWSTVTGRVQSPSAFQKLRKVTMEYTFLTQKRFRGMSCDFIVDQSGRRKVKNVVLRGGNSPYISRKCVQANCLDISIFCIHAMVSYDRAKEGK